MTFFDTNNTFGKGFWTIVSVRVFSILLVLFFSITSPPLWSQTMICTISPEFEVTIYPLPTAPTLTGPQLNACPNLTVNLTTLSSGLTPSVSGSIFEWHLTNNKASALVSPSTAVMNGTYYLFEKSPSNCYSSGTGLSVSIQQCCPVPINMTLPITRTN